MARSKAAAAPAAAAAAAAPNGAKEEAAGEPKATAAAAAPAGRSSCCGGLSCCFLGLLLGLALGLAGAVGAVLAADAGHLGVARADVEAALGAAGVPPGHRLVGLLAGSLGSGQPQPSSAEACPASTTTTTAADHAKASLEAELGQLRAQLEDARAELKKARAAWASEREELREELQRARIEGAGVARSESGAMDDKAEAKAPREEPWKTAAEAAWPQCVAQGAGLRGPETYALVDDVGAVLGDLAGGCSQGNCAATSTFDAESIEDCARVCAAIPRCAFWSSPAAGPGGGGRRRQCRLWSGDGGGREAADGSAAAAQGCAPPPTEVSPGQIALVVLDSPALQACDGGAVGPQCRDLHDAMRTWSYGIRSLKMALQGAASGMEGYLVQIEADAGAFLNTPPGSPGLQDMFPIAVANNRQVFEAVRHLLAAQRGAPAVGRLDISAPPPVRGLLCKAGQCGA